VLVDLVVGEKRVLRLDYLHVAFDASVVMRQSLVF
jgi:hypothetical protein